MKALRKRWAAKKAEAAKSKPAARKKNAPKKAAVKNVVAKKAAAKKTAPAAQADSTGSVETGARRDRQQDSRHPICTQERTDPFRHHIRFGSLAFPNREHVPSQRPECLLVFPVPPLISFQLRTPVFDTGFGNVRVYAAPMLVPKAALNLDDFL